MVIVSSCDSDTVLSFKSVFCVVSVSNGGVDKLTSFFVSGVVGFSK